MTLCRPPGLGALLLTLAALFFADAQQACAQREPSPTELAAARQEFATGVRAARESHWEEARASFERSYALYPHPLTLFNLAGARRQLGQLVAAAEAYRKYLRASPADTAPESRAQAEQALAEIEPSLAQLRLEISGLAPADIVKLDGVELPHKALGAQLPIDPGHHVVAVERDRTAISQRELDAAQADALALSLALPSLPPTPVQVARAAEREPARAPELPAQDAGQRPRVWRRWWFWTAVGVAVAGAVTGAVLATRDRGDDAVTGNLPPGEVPIR